MTSIPILVKNESLNSLPSYAKDFDSGVDLMADFSQGVTKKFLFGASYIEESSEIIIPPMCRALIPTNLYTAIPEGYEIQIRPRSGIALKEGVIVLNTPGTIDAGYRNSWGIILINLGTTSFSVKQGDKIAQAVLMKVEKIQWAPVEELPESSRGLGGFGHTGITNIPSGNIAIGYHSLCSTSINENIAIGHSTGSDVNYTKNDTNES